MATGIWAGETRSVQSEPQACGSHQIGPSHQIGSDAQSDDLTVEALLGRMRRGDREAAAAFITRYGPRLRRRVRGKLGPAMRRLFDSQEILSTVSRRLDMYVAGGRLQAAGEGQLWSLIFKMADHALIDKQRTFQHLQNVEGSDSEFARQMLHSLENAERRLRSGGAEIEIDQALHALSSHTEREILSMWLMGHPHGHIARELGMTETSVRKRWQAMKERLRERFEHRGEMTM